MARHSSRNTSVRFEDAVGFGLTVGPGPGDFNHGGTNSENAERIRVMDRNQFDGHVVGDDLEQDWSITVGLRNAALTSASADLVQDFVQRTGKFAPEFTQSLSSNPDVWAFKVIVTMILGGVTTSFDLPHNVADHSFAEAKEGHTLAVSGLNNGPIVRS